MSRATAAWRHFKFFETEAIHGAIETLPINLTCTCTYKNVDHDTKSSVDGYTSNNVKESPYCIYGDVHGVIHVLDKSGKVTLARFQAYENAVTHMIYVIEWSILITIGNDAHSWSNKATHSTTTTTTSSFSVNSLLSNTKNNDVSANEVSIVRFWRIDQCVSYYHQLIAEEKLFLREEEQENEVILKITASSQGNESNSNNLSVNQSKKTRNTVSSHASLSSSKYNKINNISNNDDVDAINKTKRSSHPLYRPPHTSYNLLNKTSWKSELPLLSLSLETLCLSFEQLKDKHNYHNHYNNTSVRDNSNSAAKERTEQSSVQTAVVNFDFCVSSQLMAIALCTNECVLLRVHLDKLYDNISNSNSTNNSNVYEVQRLRSTIARGNLTFVALPSPHRVQVQPRYLSSNDNSLLTEIECQGTSLTLSNREQEPQQYQGSQLEELEKRTNTQEKEISNAATDAPSRLLESTSSLLKSAWTSAMSPTSLAAMTETFVGKGNTHMNQENTKEMLLPHQVVYTIYEDVVSAWSVIVQDMTTHSSVSKQNAYYNSTSIRNSSNYSNNYKGKYECREWQTALPFGAFLHFACLSSQDTLMLMHLHYNNDDMKSQNTAFSTTTTTSTSIKTNMTNMESHSQEINKVTLAILGKRNNKSSSTNCVEYLQKQGREENAPISKRVWCDPTLQECVQIVQVADKSLFQSQISGKSFEQIQMTPARLHSIGNYAIIISHERTSHTFNVCSVQCYDWQHKLRLLSANQMLYWHLLLIATQNKELVMHTLVENVMETEQELSQRQQHKYTNKDNRKSSDVENTQKEVNEREVKYNVIRLREMDLNRKLELLFNRECYSLAQMIVDDAVHETDNDIDVDYDEHKKNEHLQSVSPSTEINKIISRTIRSSNNEKVQATTSSNALRTNKMSKRKLSPLQVYVHKCYGDYLFHKGRWTEAMTQYIDTIGTVEPSYVIQKYSGVNVEEEQYQHDNGKIEHVSINNELLVELTRYLEALHHIDFAKDVLDTTYTTLLIHCYLRQQQQHFRKEEEEWEENDKLLSFIKRNDVRFNAVHAIDVCRAHHATRAASTLAEKYALNLLHVNIVLYDEASAHRALELIRSLNVDEAEEALWTMGKDLMAMAPRETTELCTELCVHWSGPPRRLTNVLNAQNTTLTFATKIDNFNKVEETNKVAHRADANNFIRVFVNSPRCLFHFLRAVIASGVYDDDITTTINKTPQEENHDNKHITENFELEQHKTATEQSNTFNIKATDENATHYLHSVHARLYNTLFELYLTPFLQTHLGPDKQFEENGVSSNNFNINNTSSNVREECNVKSHNSSGNGDVIDGNVSELSTDSSLVNNNKNSSVSNTHNHENENVLTKNKTVNTNETNTEKTEVVCNTGHKPCTNTSISSSEITEFKQESNNNTFPDEPLEQRHTQALHFLHMYKNKYDATWALCLSYQHHFQEGVNYLLQEHYTAIEVFQFYSAQLRSIAQHTACFDLNKYQQKNSKSTENSKDMFSSRDNNNFVPTYDYKEEYDHIQSSLEYMLKICTEIESSIKASRVKESQSTSQLTYEKREHEKCNTSQCEELKTMWQTLLIWLAFYVSEFAKYKNTSQYDSKNNNNIIFSDNSDNNHSSDHSSALSPKEQQQQKEQWVQMSEELECVLMNVLEHLADSYCKQQQQRKEKRAEKVHEQRTRKTNQEYQEDVQEELEHSQVLSVLQPNEVIELLTANHVHLEYRIIRLYCERVMEMQEKTLNYISTSVENEQEHIYNKLQSSLHECYTTATIFSNAICNTCEMALDAPAVYFMCHHAFHVHCLHNAEECNLCGSTHRQQLTDLLSHNRIANSYTNILDNNVSTLNKDDIKMMNNSQDLFQNIVSGVCSTHRLCHHHMQDSMNSSNKGSSIEEQMSSLLLLSSSSSSPNKDIYSCIDYGDWYIDDSVDPTQYEIW